MQYTCEQQAQQTRFCVQAMVRAMCLVKWRGKICFSLLLLQFNIFKKDTTEWAWTRIRRHRSLWRKTLTGACIMWRSLSFSNRFASSWLARTQPRPRYRRYRPLNWTGDIKRVESGERNPDITWPLFPVQSFLCQKYAKRHIDNLVTSIIIQTCTSFLHQIIKNASVVECAALNLIKL